jgi:hypothetical protein
VSAATKAVQPEPRRSQLRLVPEPDAAAEEPVPPREEAPLVDPRVAKRGGTRKDRKSNYDYPGMASDGDWRETEVHRHTRWYGCALCGLKVSGPHAVYTHLAKVHDR